MANDNLYNICRNLSWTKIAEYKYADESSTVACLMQLFEQYGYAKVLAELASIWKNDRSLAFWERFTFPMPNCNMDRIVIASSYTKGYNGGIERVQAQLMTMWTEMGHEVVFLSEEMPNDNDYPYPEQVKRIVIPNGKELEKRLQHIEDIIKEKHINIFINHYWWEEAAIWECVLCRLLGVGYITYCHGLFTAIYRDGYEFGYLSYKAFRLNNLIISLSSVGARFNQLCGCRSYLVQNPIPQELKNDNMRANLNNHKILWIGRIDEDKRPTDAVQILARVKQVIPDVTMEFVGKPEEVSYRDVLRTASELNVSDSIEWKGYNSDTSDAYLNCGLMLFTSPEEGYPMTMIESKAYGVPCVMYSLPYLRVVQDNKGIVTANIGDIDAMASHVAELFRNDDMRRKMGEYARESFEELEKYDICKAWNDIFKLTLQNCCLKCADYYDPNLLTESEKSMLPMLLDQFYEGMKSIRKDSVDYRIGNRALKIPRKAAKAYRKILGHPGKV